MKFDIKIIYDNEWFIGYCPNLIGCYVQGSSEQQIKKTIEKAIKLYISNYEQRYEPLVPEPDSPQLDVKIKYNRINTFQLTAILKKFGYNLDYYSEDLLLFRKKDFPFYRLIIPNSDHISDQIILRIFGSKNVMHLAENQKYSRINDQV
jgi:predicted RNase H-like HicB family nuclease